MIFDTVISSENKLRCLENELTYEQYKSLRDSVGWSNFSKEQAEKALANSTHVLSVAKGDEAIAMARLIGDGVYYLIADVVVMPEFQRKGIGTFLMNGLLEYIETSVPEGGRVSVQIIAEKGKEDFYKRLGFKLIPHEYCGSGMRKVIYREKGK